MTHSEELINSPVSDMTDMSKNPKDGAKTIKESCIEKFREWWEIEELSSILSRVNPSILGMFSGHDAQKISNSGRLAEILFDSVGVRFLRNIENDPVKRRLFLDLILNTVIDKKLVRKEDILDMVKSSVSAGRAAAIKDINGVIALDPANKLCGGLADILGLPPAVAEKEHVEHLPDTEVIEPHVQLNPLYDYQNSTGMVLTRMLEGEELDEGGREVKRKLIAVPTGSGKTRMIVETLIEWLNGGKKSKNEQQSNSKFILWIAQSGELCEQAFSTFRSVFESSGRRGTTLRLHRFWGQGGELPSLEMDELFDEKGVIVATIQSLHKIYKRDPSQLETLGRLTSCIIMDEAHHSTGQSYSDTLRKMGFNWDNRKKEISEMGVILIGLTATPFKGRGNNEETERLKRRYAGVFFPSISHYDGADNFDPHAIIDCQMFAHADEDVRILGKRSYYRDGFIREDDYNWKISRGKKAAGKVWRFERTKNVTFRFPEPGEYRISLTVTANDGDTNTSSTHIEILERPSEVPVMPEEQQKHLYHKLIRRKILCDVYHKILQSDRIMLGEDDIKHMNQFGEFRKNTLKEIGRNFERNKLIIQEIHDLKETGKKKILFFGCSVEHSRQIAMYLKTLYGIRVRYVDSKMDLDSRVNAIELFRSGDLEVLCNFDVLTTGFDAPNVDCVFVGRPIKSTLLYTQMIGRGMRGTKSGGTEDVLLVDIDDNFQLRGSGDGVELGWKIYRPYWKSLDEPDAEPEEPEVDLEEDELDDAYARTCVQCGDVAEGLESIREIFGVEGSDEVLVEYLEAGGDTLPAKCKKCRKA